MASLQFEGVLQMSEKQEQFIREVLEKKGFTNNKVVFAAAGQAGDNFVANVLRITVDGDGAEDFKLIAKIAPQLEALRGAMNTALLFNNESIMYEQVLPKFKSLQIEAGVPEDEIYKFAECYGCLTEEPNEVILLEDLKPLDYVMIDRLAPMDEDAVLLVLKNFAILHSMSFVLKHLEPETFEKFTNRLGRVWDLMSDRQEQKDWMAQVEKSALEVLDDEEYKRAIRGVVSETHTFVKKVKKNENPKYLVIQQGDAWTNNIMFKLNATKPVDAIMIDYQMSSETSPVTDFFYFIFNSTSYASRAKLYYKWIDYYYEQFDKSLSNFGLKSNFVYPRDQLDADLRRYAKVYFGTVVMLFSVLSRSPEEAAEMHEAITKFDEDKLEGMQVGALSGDTVTKFKNNIKGLVDSFREFGYIS